MYVVLGGENNAATGTEMPPDSEGHSWRDLIPVIKVDIPSVRGF
jgi:hypothetical protein